MGGEREAQEQRNGIRLGISFSPHWRALSARARYHFRIPLACAFIKSALPLSHLIGCALSESTLPLSQSIGMRYHAFFSYLIVSSH